MVTKWQYREAGAGRRGYTVGSHVQREGRAKPGSGPCTVSTNPLWIMDDDVKKKAGGVNTNIDNFVTAVPPERNKTMKFATLKYNPLFPTDI